MSLVEAGSPHPSTTMSDSESEHAPSADEADPGHTVTIASQVTHHTVVPPKQGSKAKPKDKKDIKTKELSLVYITGTGKPAGFARVTGWVRVRVQPFGPGRNPYPARVTRHLFWYPSTTTFSRVTTTSSHVTTTTFHLIQHDKDAQRDRRHHPHHLSTTTPRHDHPLSPTMPRHHRVTTTTTSMTMPRHPTTMTPDTSSTHHLYHGCVTHND